MELVAMDMKQRGLYIARQLSFYGVAFHIDDVPLSREFIHVYNASVRLVCDSAALLVYCTAQKKRWHGGATGRALDLRSTGRGFNSYTRGKSCVTTFGKLFTPV